MAVTYECQSCKKTVTLPKKGKIPLCCGKPMKQIPVDMCLQPSHPEHVRPMDAEDTCDDFRAGK
jgi:hypothetical protein